jgi:methionyl-tRNA synthetase
VATSQWVDDRAAQFLQLADDLKIDYARFIRTTEKAHVQAVHSLWRSLRPDDVYLKAYRGLYCSACEDFLFEKDLVEGKCPEHRKSPAEVAERNYFFRLSAYQGRIEEWLKSGEVSIRPERRRKEILQFVRLGLEDISISRLASRSGGWGVPVPDDDSQIVYVWIDALVNYLTGLGYGGGDGWREWWNGDTRKIHVIGKNVWKFHAIYWPALLLSAGLPLPDELVIHGFLTADGQKIGKSAGNAIAPDDFIQRYGADAVRYFLLRAVPAFDDGDFSATRFSSVYDADLANGLGNLVSRLLTLAVKSGLENVGPEEPHPTVASIERARSGYQHDEALTTLWQRIDALNRELELAKPWIELKSGNAVVVRSQVDGWLRRVVGIAQCLEPYLPETATRILVLVRARPLGVSLPLFPRLPAGINPDQRECPRSSPERP